MASTLTYGEGITKLQLAFAHSFNLPGKVSGSRCEMSLRDMLAKVSVVDEADIVAIGTLIGKMAPLAVWKTAMMQCDVEFPRHKHGPASRKIAFKYWWMPINMLDLVPPDKLDTRIVAEEATLEAAPEATAAVPLPLPPPLPPPPAAEEEEEEGEPMAEVLEGEEKEPQLDTSFASLPCNATMSSLTPEQYYCQGISDKSTFFHPYAIELLLLALSVVWMATASLWRSTKCSEKITPGHGDAKRCDECTHAKRRWRDILAKFQKTSSNSAVDSSTAGGASSADLLRNLKGLLSRLQGGDWTKIRLEAKALVCRTSFAGEKVPKGILINERDAKDKSKVTLCCRRAEANMANQDSCEGFVVSKYEKDEPLCDVCKSNNKKEKRKLSSSSSSSGNSAPDSLLSSKTKNSCLSEEQLRYKSKALAGALKKARVVANRYKEKLDRLQADHTEHSFVQEDADKIKNIFKSLRENDFDLKTKVVELITTHCADRISSTRSLTSEQKVVVTYSFVLYYVIQILLLIPLCSTNRYLK